MLGVMATESANAERLRGILRAVVEENFGGNQAKAARGLGVAQPLISQVLAGLPGRNVGAGMVFALAKYTGRSLDDLWGWAGARWSGTPGWDAAIAAARVAFPRVSERAWRHLGDLMGAPPPPLEPGVLGTIAATWDLSPAGRAAEVREESESQMAVEDRRGSPPVEPFDPGPPPSPRKPRAVKR